jgi:hypothetical protein
MLKDGWTGQGWDNNGNPSQNIPTRIYVEKNILGPQIEMTDKDPYPKNNGNPTQKHSYQDLRRKKYPRTTN